MLAIVIGALIIGCACASPIDPRIVGGTAAEAGQFPHQVSLRSPSNGKHFCGASIIGSQWLLTAAHCVPGLTPSNLVVVVGSIHLNAGGLGYTIAQIVSHAEYNPQINVNDIAVLKINGNIKFDENVKSITLASSSPASGTTLTLSGWGLTSYPSNVLPNELQYVELNAISVAECKAKLPGFPVFNTHQCTSSPAGQGACKGDSGGPLIDGSEQVGIVSWGVPCAKGNPDVFTSVASYREWIRTTTGL